MNHHSCDWKVILLLDHREFLNSNSDFRTRAKNRITKHFLGTSLLDSVYPLYCEEQALVSGDYMFVARQIHPSTGQVLQERVLDLVIERKDVYDLQACLIKPSKKYAPLSFFEAQMYKMQQSGIGNKIFLMEGDEDAVRHYGDPKEFEKRRLRVKTMRNQILGGEWPGVTCISTKDKNHSLQFLIDQMTALKHQLAVESNIPSKTMEEHKNFVNTQMKDITFMEYLRLRKIKGTGDKKAMKAIMDPESSWDKTFRSPACVSKSKEFKSTLEDRATYYVSPSTCASSVSRTTVVPNSTTLQARQRNKKSITPSSAVNSNTKRKTSASSISGSSISIPIRSSVVYTARNDLTGGSGLGLGGFQIQSRPNGLSFDTELEPLDTVVNRLFQFDTTISSTSSISYGNATSTTSSSVTSTSAKSHQANATDPRRKAAEAATKRASGKNVDKRINNTKRTSTPSVSSEQSRNVLIATQVSRSKDIVEILDSDDEQDLIPSQLKKRRSSVEVIEID